MKKLLIAAMLTMLTQCGSQDIGEVSFQQVWSNQNLVPKSPQVKLDFYLINHSRAGVKDVRIGCEGLAPSGTVVDRIYRTIYETFDPESKTHFQAINFGYVQSDVEKLTCKVIDYQLIKKNNSSQKSTIYKVF